MTLSAHAPAQEPNPAFDPARPFARAAGIAAGIPPRMFRTSTYRRLFHGIYVASGVEVDATMRAAAALVPFGPAAWASHATAARVYGLPLPTIPEEHVTVTDPDERRDRAGIICHLSLEEFARLVDGVRVSAPQHVFVELGTMLSLVELVAAGDHLVRHGLIPVDALLKHSSGIIGPGAAPARAAAGFVRERVDSPMETRLRMLIVLAGLPEPEVNLTFGDDRGLRLRRYDLCWPQARLIVEYDGRHHIEREQQWESDLERRELIDNDGWRILVITAKGIFQSPEATLTKIHRLLRERGMPGVPIRLDSRWRRHFPGHA